MQEECNECSWNISNGKRMCRSVEGGAERCRECRTKRTSCRASPRRAARNGKACSCVGDERWDRTFYRAALIRPTARDRDPGFPKGTDSRASSLKDEEKERREKERTFASYRSFVTEASRLSWHFTDNSCRNSLLRAANRPLRGEGGGAEGRGHGNAEQLTEKHLQSRASIWLLTIRHGHITIARIAPRRSATVSCARESVISSSPGTRHRRRHVPP